MIDTSRPARPGVWRNVTPIVCGTALAFPLVSLGGTAFVPVTLRVTLVGLWLTAVVRPFWALLALALLGPFGSVFVTAFDAPPIQYTEALVLAVLSGSLIATGTRREALTPASSRPMALPATVFGGIVLCSLAVVLGVTQAGLDIRWAFIREVGTFVRRDYLVGPPEQWGAVTAAARLLEGAALFVIANRAGDGPRRPTAIMWALSSAAAIAAAMNVKQLVTMGSGTLTDVLTRRISIHVADANAAGSYFAMMTFVALALAANGNDQRRLRVLPGAIAAASLAAVWLSGSRAALASTVTVLLTIAIGAAWRRHRPSAKGVIAGAAAGAALVGILIVGLDPRAISRRGFGTALSERGAFTVTGLRMMATAPVFGVGVGRYFEMSRRFMPQSIYWFHFRENAHNNFLQVGGELGLVGLTAFVWLLASAGGRAWRGWRASPADRLLGGALAGLATFVATWLAGHPLLTPEVAFPFWILAGAVVARADAGRRQSLAEIERSDGPTATLGPRRPATVTTFVLLGMVAIVPLRIRQGASALNFSEETFGFYEWEGTDPSTHVRWAAPHAVFFVPARAGEIDIPLSAAFSNVRPTTTVVSFAIDGRIFYKLGLTTGDWSVLRLPLPAAVDSRPYRRMDVVTEPAWSPAALLGTHDSRVLGIKLGVVVAR